MRIQVAINASYHCSSFRRTSMTIPHKSMCLWNGLRNKVKYQNVFTIHVSYLSRVRHVMHDVIMCGEKKQEKTKTNKTTQQQQNCLFIGHISRYYTIWNIPVVVKLEYICTSELSLFSFVFGLCVYHSDMAAAAIVAQLSLGAMVDDNLTAFGASHEVVTVAVVVVVSSK